MSFDELVPPAPDLAATVTDDRYRLTHAAQIGTVLRDLGGQRCLLNVRTRDGRQFVTTILRVDPAGRTFVLDWYRDAAACEALLASDESAVSGLLRGVPVSFSIGTPAATRIDGHPAFVASFPAQLHYLQRRRHFRARTLVTRGYCCEIRLPDAVPFLLDIADLSLSGVGLRSRTVTSAHLPVGTTVAKCLLDFREMGRLELGLQVVGHWLVGGTDAAVHHFGCAFLAPHGRLENRLQQMVFAIEAAYRNGRNGAGETAGA